MSTGKAQAFAVWCVKQKPDSTARELDRAYAPRADRSVGKRLTECERLGLVRRGAKRRCTVTGRTAATWRLTQAGRKK